MPQVLMMKLNGLNGLKRTGPRAILLSRYSTATQSRMIVESPAQSQSLIYAFGVTGDLIRLM